jgi:hypothetical protein
MRPLQQDTAEKLPTGIHFLDLYLGCWQVENQE